jgi:DNA-binding MarR family transcriptional regulator
MPQLILPLIPQGATPINQRVSVFRDEDSWTYFIGAYPVYSHRSGDQKTFRFVSSQLIQSGAARQMEIQRAFGVSKSSVIRSLKRLQRAGAGGFFSQRRGSRGGTVLTAEVLEKAQRLLDQGYCKADVARELGVGYDTCRKAIHDGRLVESARQELKLSKSERSAVDAAAGEVMGVGCTRVPERVLTSMGQLAGAASRFEPCVDVPQAGALCALPALLANGLLNGAKQFLGELKGYYTSVQVLLVLALMVVQDQERREDARPCAGGVWQAVGAGPCTGSSMSMHPETEDSPAQYRNMIAYRAETAMVNLMTGPVTDSSQARRILQDLFVIEADILPDPDNERLTIRVHGAARPAVSRVLKKLFEHLTDAQEIYPGTQMRIVYELLGYPPSNAAEGVTLSSQR